MLILILKSFTDFHKKKYSSCLMEEIMSVALFVYMVMLNNVKIVTTKPGVPSTAIHFISFIDFSNFFKFTISTENTIKSKYHIIQCSKLTSVTSSHEK